LNCPQMKLLCQHIVDCKSESCGRPGCFSSRSVLRHAAVLRHIQSCREDATTCQFCVSVRNATGASESSVPVSPAQSPSKMSIKRAMPVLEEASPNRRPFKKRRVRLDTSIICRKTTQEYY
jgi:hypothetical protein